MSEENKKIYLLYQYASIDFENNTHWCWPMYKCEYFEMNNMQT